MLCSSILTIVFLLWTAVVLVSVSVEGRRCYECSTITSEHACLYNPENVTETRNFVRCKFYCTIERKEFVNIPGSISIASLTRGCEKEPAILDGVVMSDIYIIYYRSCTTHLCNTGDGTTRLPNNPRNATDYDYDYEDNAGPPVVVNLYVLIFTVIFPVYYFLTTTVSNKQCVISHFNIL